MTNINDPKYSPDPYAHAVRHLDAAEDELEHLNYEQSQKEALIGIGWALLAVASRTGLFVRSNTAKR